MRLGQRKYHGYRPILHDRNYRLVRDLDQIADVGLVEADPAVDRSVDRAVANIDLCCLHRRCVGLDRRSQLVDRRLLIVDLLNRGELALREVLVALKIELRALQLCGVLGALSGRLVQDSLVRSRIDLRDHVALMHLLAFLYRDGDQHAVHLRFHADDIECLHGPKAAQINGNIADFCWNDGDRRRRQLRCVFCSARGRTRGVVAAQRPEADAQCDNKYDQQWPPNFSDGHD